jgi:hypothetical protein
MVHVYSSTKYGDQSNFVPFIVETGGAAGRKFFDTVSGGRHRDGWQGILQYCNTGQQGFAEYLLPVASYR